MSYQINFINTPELYANLLEKLSQYKIFFIDTEFIREKTYRPVVALIQIAVDVHDAYLIDPLVKDFDIRPLLSILTKDDVKIVFHSARQDLEIFYHEYKTLFKNVIDTQIIAAALGYGDQIGFEGIVKMVTGDFIDKSQQRTDWLHRPLHNKQMEYAAFDVLYLAKIYPVLESAMTAQNRWEWVHDDMSILMDEKTFLPQYDAILKKIKYQLHNTKSIKLLYHIALFREHIAIERNVIRTMICPDDILVTFADKRPKSIETMHKIKAFQHRFIQEYLDDLLNISINLVDFPDTIMKEKKYDKLTHSQERLLQILSLAADAIANNHSVARRLFAPSHDINEYVRNDDALFMHGWRFKLFGSVVKQIQNGEAGIYYHNGQINFK